MSNNHCRVIHTTGYLFRFQVGNGVLGYLFTLQKRRWIQQPVGKWRPVVFAKLVVELLVTSKRKLLFLVYEKKNFFLDSGVIFIHRYISFRRLYFRFLSLLLFLDWCKINRSGALLLLLLVPPTLMADQHEMGTTLLPLGSASLLDRFLVACTQTLLTRFLNKFEEYTVGNNIKQAGPSQMPWHR